jgi:hypothetical protein
MKTYNTPRVASTGDVVELTRTIDHGVNDPKGMFTIQLQPPGSVGFLL